MGLPKLLTKSDSQVVIKSILDQSQALKLIMNLVEDTSSLTKNFLLLNNVIVIEKQIS